MVMMAGKTKNSSTQLFFLAPRITHGNKMFRISLKRDKETKNIFKKRQRDKESDVWLGII